MIGLDAAIAVAVAVHVDVVYCVAVARKRLRIVHFLVQELQVIVVERVAYALVSPPGQEAEK